MKTETEMITSIAVSPVGQAVILEIMYVETFKTDIIIFISNIIISLTSHIPIIFKKVSKSVHSY